jgi:hypothetical protein
LIDIYTDEHEFHNRFICNKFIIERKLGFKKDLPGANHWELKLEEEGDRPSSYILDRHIYSYVFYSRLIHNELANTEENKRFVSHYTKKLCKSIPGRGGLKGTPEPVNQGKIKLL